MLKQVAGSEKSLNRNIKNGFIIQPGFEMSGFMFPQERGHIFLFSFREKKYVHYAMNDSHFKKVFEKLISLKPPCFIFDYCFTCPPFIKKICNKYDVAVLQVNKSEKSITYHLHNFLSETFAPSIEVHASCISIFGRGVLIFGESGIGKSEATLELIKKKHLFVCDDRVILKRVGSKIIATSPEVIKNLIEVRGIGILNIKNMFGIQACTNNVKIDLLIKLKDWKTNSEVDRLGDTLFYENILNIPIQYYDILVKQGRAVSELIETAVIGFLLRKDGLSTVNMLNKRLIIEQQKKK